MNTLMKKAIAECFGTFVLVFFSVGTAILTGSVVATSLAFGLSIVAMAFSIGRISGCHVNPAVSLGCLLTKRMSLKEFGVYVGAQCVGAIVAALLLFACLSFGFDVNFSKAFGVTAGSDTAVGGEYSWGGVFAALIVEVVLTCVFVYVILVVTDGKATEGDEYKVSGSLAGIIIGATLTLCHLVGISLTGTSVNPARSLGTAIGDLFATGDWTAMGHLWMFIVGPMAGAVVAAYLYNLLHKDAEEAPKAEEAVEAPKAEVAKEEAEEAPKAEEVAEAPKAEEVVEAPKTEEAPKVEEAVEAEEAPQAASEITAE